MKLELQHFAFLCAKPKGNPNPCYFICVAGSDSIDRDYQLYVFRSVSTRFLKNKCQMVWNNATFNKVHNLLVTRRETKINSEYLTSDIFVLFMSS